MAKFTLSLIDHARLSRAYFSQEFVVSELAQNEQ